MMHFHSSTVILTLFAATVMDVLFLARPRILEPHLGDTFAETGDGRYAFEILPVGIAIDLEVGLQHLQLFFGECGADTFRFAFVVAVGVAAVLNGEEMMEKN